jgi:hypothetical protein
MRQPAQLSGALPAEEDSQQGKRLNMTQRIVYLPTPRDTNVSTASMIGPLTNGAAMNTETSYTGFEHSYKIWLG